MDNIIIEVKNLSYRYRSNKRINDKTESVKTYKDVCRYQLIVVKGENLNNRS